MKQLTVVTPTYNEEDNVESIYKKVKEIFSTQKYKSLITYKHLFIDNSSKDGTIKILRKLASEDKNVQIIINRKNYGHIRSPYYGLTQTNTDAAIFLVADGQDPPSLITTFVEKWLNGEMMVLGVKSKSNENKIIFRIRKTYYKLLNFISYEPLIENFMGFGLYDKEVINYIKSIKDPEPYLRGIVVESGYDYSIVKYNQEIRKAGKSKNNFFTLYDMAMIGITSFSKAPLRLISLFGFIFSFLSLFSSIAYVIYKIIFWERFVAGVIPLILISSILLSIILLFLGIISEYILSIHLRLKERKIVEEKERINF